MAKAKRRRQSSSAAHRPYGQRMFGDVLAMAETVAASRKHLAAERLTDLATATRKFRTTAGEFPYLRDYTDAAAEKIDEFADYVDRTEIPDMVEDMASFAKRQPMATLALGVAAGLVTTQLIRGWPLERGEQSGGVSGRKGKKRRATR